MNQICTPVPLPVLKACFSKDHSLPANSAVNQGFWGNYSNHYSHYPSNSKRKRKRLRTASELVDAVCEDKVLRRYFLSYDIRHFPSPIRQNFFPFLVIQFKTKQDWMFKKTFSIRWAIGCLWVRRRVLTSFSKINIVSSNSGMQKVTYLPIAVMHWELSTFQC
jgi:hypothetical protein